MARARDQVLASRASAEAEEDCGGGEGGEGGEEWRRTGGTLDLPSAATELLELRLLLDGSLVEVFCLSSGQVLATRCYRCGYDDQEGEDGERDEGGDSDDQAPLALYAFGPSESSAVVEVVRGESYAMRSCFVGEEEEEEEEEWERVEEAPAVAGATAAVSLRGGGADKAR